jgi:hypothetical protein
MLDAPDDLSKTRPRDRDGPEIPLMVRSEQYMRYISPKSSGIFRD